MKKHLPFALLVLALNSCNGRLSQEQAKERIERYLASNVQPGYNYIPIATEVIDTPPKDESRWAGATFAVHRFQLKMESGEREERIDTMLIKGDSIVFVGSQKEQ